MMKQKILVTGSNGQLGKELRDIATHFPQYDFIFLGREDLPIHHFEMVRHYFSTYHPQYVINCAAYTAVDRAEQEKDLAFQVNGEAVGVLAAVCKEHHCRFIHISTDYVFDGNGTAPYKEEDAVSPVNTYGASKLEGERQAMLLNPDSIIIRTSWVYSVHGKNFVRTMLKLMAEKESINVVSDQAGSPTYAADLAEAIMDIISYNEWKPGIYHYSNEGNITWFDFANAIKEISGSQCVVNPIPTSSYPTPAKRPAYSVMDKTKITQAFGIGLKDWKDSLTQMITCLSN
ncbi:MAG: dTDP-4-dehydrorhamnose reductase [Chitinophagaceae bacterium]|nr:dTDP-4-dehydrorhamnose reductase [Chitinophagaceae bacterium]